NGRVTSPQLPILPPELRRQQILQKAHALRRFGRLYFQALGQRVAERAQKLVALVRLQRRRSFEKFFDRFEVADAQPLQRHSGKLKSQIVNGPVEQHFPQRSDL